MSRLNFGPSLSGTSRSQLAPILRSSCCCLFRSPTPQNIEEIVERGRHLWQTIYTPHDVKLYNKLGAYHPDFIGMSSLCPCLARLPLDLFSFTPLIFNHVLIITDCSSI
jgi:hypothetical protein